MHDVAILSVGQSKRSWVLAGGYQIAGITIDNPSGSWLYIPQDGTYVPPYTLDFAHSFSPTLSRVDVIFQNGPAGQLSTLTGDSPFVQIYDKPVVEAAGIAGGAATFVSPRQQPEVTPVGPSALNAGLNTFTTALLTSINQRLRIYYYWARQTSPTVRSQVVVTITSSPSALITLPPLVVNQNRSMDRVVFSDPFNMPLGEELDFVAAFSALGSCQVGALVGIV